MLAFRVTAGTVLGDLPMLSLVSKVVVLAIPGANVALAVPLAAIAAIALAVRLYDLKQGTVTGVGLYWLLGPFVRSIYSLAGIRGTVEYCVSRDGEWCHASKAA